MKATAVICIVVSLVFSCWLLVPARNAQAGTPPPPDDGVNGLQYIDGDWNVTTAESYTNETIVLSGNLTIQPSGSLTFKNVTLKMNCTGNGTYHINATSGSSFYVYDLDGDNTTTGDNSVITSNYPDGKHRFLFWVRAGGNFTMKNSEVHECGYTFGTDTRGLSIYSDNCIVDSVTITDGFMGLFINHSSPVITNNTIMNNDYYGLYIYNQSSPFIGDNTIKNNAQDGIYIRQQSSPTLIGNYISDNGQDGINVRDFSHPLITNNYIVGQLQYTGINIEFDCNPEVINNTINNFYDGINIMASNPTINSNTIRNSDEDGFYIVQSSPIIQNTNIYDSGFGIVAVTGSQPTIINCTVLNTTSNDLYITANSQFTSLNSSFNHSDVQISGSDSYLTVQWYLNVFINNTADNPIVGANVRIEDNDNGTFDQNLTADANGWVKRIILTERVQNVSGNVSYTPYNVTVTKPGYLDGHAEVDMNQSTELAITLTTDNSSLVINHINPLTAKTNEAIGISANVSDDIEVVGVKLYFQNVGDTAYTPVNMVLASGNHQSGNWTATIPAQGKTGTVHYFIWANDTSGNNLTSPAMGNYAIQIIGPPGIAVSEPVGGEIWTGGSNHWIEFIASDTEDVPAALDVFLNYTSATAGNDFIAQIKGDASSYGWLLPIINATDVRIIATIIDSDGNKAFAESPMFAIDSSPPKIVSTNPANNSTGVSLVQPVIIQFSEQMNISSVVVNQTNGTNPGGWSWFWNENKDTVTGIHNAWPRGEVVEITVQAGYRDASAPGNANNTAYVFTFTTEINPAPKIIHANVTGPVELGDSVRINATITDNGTVMNAVLWWRDVDGVWHENQIQKSGDDWFYLLPGQMKEGRVRYQINVTDDLGQKNTTVIYEFDIVDTMPPVIAHTSIENAVIDEPINITCLITDLGGVGAVHLHHRNESEANFTQVAMSPGYWYELTAHSEPGTIEYYIRAVDIYGNEASTGIYSSEIIDPAIPDTTPPEVLFVGPTGSNIPVSTSISIVFSEAMDRVSVEETITVSPVISNVSYTWLNNQTLIVSFDALRYNTTYTVTVGAGARDLAGNGLASGYLWEFSTVEESEIVEQPTPDNWGWIGIIIFLIAIIALLMLYLIHKKKKEPEKQTESM